MNTETTPALDLEALAAHAILFRIADLKATIASKSFYDNAKLYLLDDIFDAEAGRCSREIKEWEILRSLHCADYVGMPPNIKAAIPELVATVIEAARSNYEARRAQKVAP